MVAKPPSVRKLALWMSIALVMGNMIGSGVFLLPASLAPYGLNSVVAWLVTAGREASLWGLAQEHARVRARGARDIRVSGSVSGANLRTGAALGYNSCGLGRRVRAGRIWPVPTWPVLIWPPSRMSTAGLPFPQRLTSLSWRFR